MISYSKKYNELICDTDPIDRIAVYLANRFGKRLFDSYKENSYPVYVKCLAEILNWSREFYHLYCCNENNRGVSEGVTDAIYSNGVHGTDFLLAWGEKRVKQFFVQKTNEPEYSQKYSSNGKDGLKFTVGN